MRKVTEDYIGTCQACFGEFKVGDDKLMVLHGFKRPGDGMTHGECAGYNHKPFEYEHTLTDIIITSLQEQVAKDQKFLAALEGGEVVTLFRMEKQYDANHRSTGTKLIEYTPADKKWPDVLRGAIYKVEADIRWNEGLISYFQSRVAAWQRLPIVGIDTPVTGRERGLAKAYDPVEAAAAEARDAEKTARDAKPGKLKLIFYRPHAKRPSFLGLTTLAEERARRDYWEQTETGKAAWIAEIKAWAKATYPGKVIVRDAYDTDLPSRIARTGDFEVVTVNLDWQYLDAIEKDVAGAERYEIDKKKRSFTVRRERNPDTVTA